MNKTSIEWTHRPETGGAAGGFTWNPIRARRTDGQNFDPHTGLLKDITGTFCTHASPGCLNCYAEAIGKRFGTGLAFNVPNLEKIEFFIDEKILAEPLRRKKPATIFVGDMFDLFHEAIPPEMIVRVLEIAWHAPQHTFQFLTKRAAHMRTIVTDFFTFTGAQEPPAHLWFGVSFESQKYADERIPLLLQTPAAVRFLSGEPLLEAVDLENLPSASGIGRYLNCLSNAGADKGALIPSAIDWVICGGESGPGARPFNLAWAEYLQEQCKSAGVAFFMKQAGSNPQVHSCRDESCTHPDCGMEQVRLKNSKGGDPAEWPESLRVRQFPSEKLVTA